MIRFIHTADIHFGMENYGKIDPTTGIHSRLIDFHAALGSCIDRAIDEQVDLFIFSGDAYKTAHPTPTQQRLLFESFLRLFRAGIPIVMVIGNHDNALSFGKANSLEIFGQVPIDGFHVMSKPGQIQLKTKNGPVNIVGIPWPSRSNIALQGYCSHVSGGELADQISAAVGQIIHHHASHLDPQIPAVLVAHLTVSSGIFSGSEKRAIYGADPVFLPSQLAIEPFDYVALGHLHRYQNLNRDGYPAIVYAGSIDRIDFGERSDTKGYCLVTIHEKNHTTHEFIPLVTRPFFQCTVHLENTEDQTEQIIEELKKLPLDRSVVKVVYHMKDGFRDRVNKTAIQSYCSAAQYIAGIIPVRQPAPTQPRIARISPEMSISTLLGAYMDAKPELLPHRERLLAKILTIAAEEEQGL